MNKKVKTIIFPVGGLGTRFLPATKATPKEMLPVAEKPLIQYAFEEAADAESIVFNSLGGLQSPNASVEFTYTRNDTIRTVAVCVVGRVQTGAACQ